MSPRDTLEAVGTLLLLLAMVILWLVGIADDIRDDDRDEPWSRDE